LADIARGKKHCPTAEKKFGKMAKKVAAFPVPSWNLGRRRYEVSKRPRCGGERTSRPKGKWQGICDGGAKEA